MTLEQNVERFFWEVDAKIMRLSRQSNERYEMGMKHLLKLVQQKVESFGKGYRGVQMGAQ